MSRFYALPRQLTFYPGLVPDRYRSSMREGNRRALNLKYKHTDEEIMFEIQRRIRRGEQEAYLRWRMMTQALDYAITKARKELGAKS